MKRNPSTYTAQKVPPSGGCNSYREEMILVGLQQQLQRHDMTTEERMRIEAEVKELEQRLRL